MTTFLNKYTTIAPTFIVASIFASVCSAGEYYKWVDEKGVTHFSERPTQTEGVEKVKTSVRQPTAEEKAQTEESLATTQAEKAQQSQYDEARCTSSQERLKTLASGSRIRMDDGNGGFYFLDKQQLEQETQRTRQAISESCKK